MRQWEKEWKDVDKTLFNKKDYYFSYCYSQILNQLNKSNIEPTLLRNELQNNP